MKILDLFMFSGENELLEVRLETLKDIVDIFVIGSCEYSHSGIRKGINRVPKELASKFNDKIIYVEIPYISNPDPWYNEMNGRQYLYEIIKSNLKAEDLLLVCDLDEIPNPEILKEESKKLNRPITFCGDYFLFCLDLWGRKSIDGFLIKNEWLSNANLNIYRSHRTNFQHKNLFLHIPNSSWHFSSVASPEWIAKKMSYFGHCNEFNNQTRDPSYIKKLIVNKCGDFSIDKPNALIQVDILKLPKYIQENKNKFKHLFYESYQ